MIYKPLSPEESVVRLAAIVDSSDDAIIGTDLFGTVNTWNAAAEKLFGYSKAEMLGQSTLLLIPPILYHEQVEKMEALHHGQRVEHYETIRLKKGGERIEVTLTISPVKSEAGELIGAAIIVREVSERRREEAMRARLAAIVESSDDAIVAKDLNGVVTDWNAAAERLFGYSKDEIVGRSILTIIPPELQHEQQGILAKVGAGHPLQHYETERLHKSGRRLQVAVSMSPIRNESGRVIGASKIVRDITERRKLENARVMLAAIVESSDDAIISKNLDGIITSWNAAAERLLGYKPEEIIGQSVLKIIPRELQHEEPGIIARLRSGRRIEHFETRRMRKNGEIFDVSLTVSPIRDEKGNVIGGSKILRDISGRKATEAALVEKEKLAAAGRLAATLAHEVNNPLEAITNLAYLLTAHEGLDVEARHYAELLLKEVQRAGEITHQTLAYYRESKIPLDVKLEQVVDHVLKGKRKKLDTKNIQLKLNIDGIPTVKGFHGELRQVFENVIDNAIDAVDMDGHIEITANEINENGERRVLVSICDDGPGIPPEMQAKIFEPFFTTKVEKGSGLGLWVSHSIVTKHGGHLRVRSNNHPGQRQTVFTIELPVFGAKKPEPGLMPELITQTARVS